VPPGRMPRCVRRGAGRCWPCWGWDDLRLVGLKLIFLIASRVVSLLGLWRRESWWKDAEILMLRHQLAVALRERPGAPARLTWPDRAWLAILAGTLPTVVDATAGDFETILVSAGRRGLQVAVAPGDLLAITDARSAPIAH